MPSVFNHEDLDRIFSLPERPQDWPSEKMADAVRLLTEWLKTPEGTSTLKPIQARALVEAHDTRRLVGLIGAGEGKALLSFLVPTVLKAQRTLIIVPAKLRRQTFDVHEKWSKEFRIPHIYGVEDTLPTDGQVIRVQSYETLSHIHYAAFVEEYEPDLIICDESHFLAHLSAGRSKRVFRYLRNRRKSHGFDSVTFIPMSGTVWRKSIREAAHIFEAALGDQSPLPTEYTVLEQVSFALDEGIRSDYRYGPGPLVRLLLPGEEPTLDALRRGLRRRLASSHGVVATSETSVGIPLIVQVRPITVPEVVRAAMDKLRTEHSLPNGDDAGDVVQVWAHAREIAAGFAYRWDPPAPEEWRLARRRWNGFVRDRISDGNQDTPLEVWNAVESGKYGEVPEWLAWKAIKDTFEPHTTPTWLSDFLLKDAEEWALKTGGCVWVGHSAAYLDGESDDDAMGTAFTKIPYFGAGDNRIEKYRGPCAASIRSHGTGKNLTAWSEALMLLPPSSGATLEQLLARHHREGQKADVVTFNVYQHSLEAVRAIITAQNDARFMEATTGNPQRILTCALLDPSGSVYDPQKALDEALDSSDPMFVPSDLTPDPGGLGLFP